MEAKNEILFNTLAKVINHYQPKYGTPSLIIFYGSQTIDFLKDKIYLETKVRKKTTLDKILDFIGDSVFGFRDDQVVFPEIAEYIQKVMGVEFVYVPKTMYKNPWEIVIMYSNKKSVSFNTDDKFKTIIANN